MAAPKHKPMQPVPFRSLNRFGFLVPVLHLGWPRRLSAETSRVFRWHMAAAYLEGAFQGCVALIGLLLRKKLQASDAEIALMQSAQTGVMIFSLFWTYVMLRADRALLTRMAGTFGRGVFLLCAVIFTPLPLIGVMTLFGLGQSLMLPAVGRMLQNSYTNEERGRLFGYITTHTTFVNLTLSLALARTLDHWPEGYRVLLPLGGLAGIGTAWIYAHMLKFTDGGADGEASEAPAGGVFALLGEAARQTLAFVRAEREFMRYQRWFFLYGCGFMSAQPLLLILLTDVLHVTYVQGALLQTVIPQLALLLLSPLVGKLYDRANPVLTMVWSALLLGAFAVVMTQCDSFAIALAGIVLYSVAMVGINLSWSLCSLYFAGERRVEPFYSLHVAMTGLRALIAPWLGVLALHQLDIHLAFYLPAIFFFACAAGMFRLHRARQLAEEMLQEA